MLLNPRTIRSSCVHRIAFVKGYNLVLTTVLRFLGQIFRERYSTRNHGFSPILELFGAQTASKPSYDQVWLCSVDSIFQGLQSGTNSCHSILRAEQFPGVYRIPSSVNEMIIVSSGIYSENFSVFRWVSILSSCAVVCNDLCKSCSGLYVWYSGMLRFQVYNKNVYWKI